MRRVQFKGDGKRPATRPIKQERAVRTREEILDKSIELFARRGFLATTMSELAKAIRMTPGALYWHFPTKEDLLLASLEELQRRFVREFEDLVLEGRRLPARRQLAGLMNRAQSFLRYHRAYGVYWARVAAEAAEGNERVAAALRESMAQYVQVLQGALGYGQTKSQELRADLDPTVLAHVVVGSHLGLILYQNLLKDTVAFEPLMEALDRLLLDALTRRVLPPLADEAPSWPLLGRGAARDEEVTQIKRIDLPPREPEE